jgi:hypothetical protein
MDTLVNTKITRRGRKSSSNLPDDPAEIAAVWPDLPEHIGAAIKALIQKHKAEKK